MLNDEGEKKVISNIKYRMMKVKNFGVQNSTFVIGH